MNGGASEPLTPVPAPLVDLDRRRLAAFADIMISGGVGLPSASEADVHGRWIDKVLTARPDLSHAVESVLGIPGNPAVVVSGLRKDAPGSLDEFGYVIASAYLINPTVRSILGYPGPLPQSNPAFPDEAEAYLEGHLLDPVLDRGPIFRSDS